MLGKWGMVMMYNVSMRGRGMFQGDGGAEVGLVRCGGGHLL